MVRPRAFDEAAALDTAIQCFWRRGLGGTSVRDLAIQMEINAPSLYNAFGDKRALFVCALDHYAARSMRARIERLERLPPKEAINVFFAELITHSIDDPDRRGCMIVNSALEISPHDRKLRAVIASYLGEIECFFLRCLERASADSGIPARVEPADTARLFLGIVLGMRVAARTKPERALLEGMARPALAMLDSPKPARKKGQR